MRRTKEWRTFGRVPHTRAVSVGASERGAVTLDLCERRGVIEAPGYPAHGLSGLIEKDGAARDELRL
jgi:hypothetical protein